MIMFLLALIACDDNAETTVTQTITFHEMEVAFEDRYGVVQAPDGEILLASSCYEEQEVLMCNPTAYGVRDDGTIVISLQSNSVGVIKYVTTTEE